MSFGSEGLTCPCGGKLVSSGVYGIAEEEDPRKIINTVDYVYCEQCGQDYAYKTVLEEIDLKEVISKEE
jgi:hypothetical protein